MSVSNGFDFFIQWHLTERCNLRCRHCYQTGNGKGEMTFKQIEKATEEISDTLISWQETYGIKISPSVNITGGEPFLRRDLYHIAYLMSRHGFDIYILTNGTLIDRDAAHNLYNLGVKGVQVSIEGPEHIHDFIRGKGSFFKSMDGIKNLLEAGLEVTLNVTLSSVNAEHISNLIRLASQMGIQRLGFSRLVASGRGRGMADKVLGSEDLRRIYKDILFSKIDNLKIVTGDPLALQLNKSVSVDEGDIPLGGCAAGISGITILPDGTMTPCRRLLIPIGNIKKDSFRNVWATSRVLGSLRDRTKYKGKCRSCKRWASCRGCRAIAYANSENGGKSSFLAEDTQCFIKDSSDD
ncbi:MAG: radical SAM protein [Thermodesulfovibrionales bacterium]|nr:radical SAM protein [Thermodesulfovibrionales bacterium]